MKLKKPEFPIRFLSSVLGFAVFLSSAGWAQVTPTPTPAAGGMTLVGVPSGVSYYDPGTPASGTTPATSPTIYGGMVASSGVLSGECATNPQVNSTCNSCTNTGLIPCNQASIHPNLYLHITITSKTPATFQQTPRVLYKIGSEVMHIPDHADAPVPGASIGVDIKWSNLCQYANNSPTCSTDISGMTLSVGIDNNGDTTFEEHVDFILNYRYVETSTPTYNTYTRCDVGQTPASTTQGICDFGVLPGDEKVYIAYFSASSNDLVTPSTAVKYDKMVLFHAKDFASLNSLSESTVVPLINHSPDIPGVASPKILGLINEQQYCFALANADQAGNLTFFTPGTDLVSAKITKYCATPSKVVGLLDDKHCFIATATFGSEMAPEVVSFRAFRNRFLLTNDPGRAFVKAYYKFGPIAANWISKSPVLKTFSLMVLWPLLLFVKLSLSIGLLATFLVVLIAAVLLRRVLRGTFRQILRRRSLTGEV